MAKVSTQTANWRLFGGGGLLVGGALWTIHVVLVQAGILTLGPWLYVVALILIAVALVLVSVGETGSNGAVGAYLLGKIALWVYAAGFLLIAVNAFQSLGNVVATVSAIFLIVGGLVSAYAIFQKRIAKGAARWFLFLPAVVGSLWALGYFVKPIAELWAIGLILAILVVITGALYLFNDRKIG